MDERSHPHGFQFHPIRTHSRWSPHRSIRLRNSTRLGSLCSICCCCADGADVSGCPYRYRISTPQEQGLLSFDASINWRGRLAQEKVLVAAFSLRAGNFENILWPAINFVNPSQFFELFPNFGTQVAGTRDTNMCQARRSEESSCRVSRVKSIIPFLCRILLIMVLAT